MAKTGRRVVRATIAGTTGGLAGNIAGGLIGGGMTGNKTVAGVGAIGGTIFGARTAVKHSWRKSAPANIRNAKTGVRTSKPTQVKSGNRVGKR